MRTGKRIRFFREQRGMTQQQLGEAVGFPTASASVRIAQYESGERTPRAALRKRFADALGVSPDALALPELDTPDGVMHTLFALEDLYGFQIAETGAEVVLRLQASPKSDVVKKPLAEWSRCRKAMEGVPDSKETYDRWRCNYSNAQ